MDDDDLKAARTMLNVAEVMEHGRVALCYLYNAVHAAHAGN